MSSPSSASSALDQSALGSYLRIPVFGEKQGPLLEAALEDARKPMARRESLLLATLGYLIVIEMLGRTVARPDTGFASRSTATDRFMAGCQEFAVKPITSNDARALYGLRCALAHEYGLISGSSSIRHVFEVNQSSSFIEHPKFEWVQIADPEEPSKLVWPKPTADNLTKISVIEVANFVEELVTNVREEFTAGNVRIAPNLSAMQLFDYGQYLIH